ncbi:MAG: metallopeptidase TldD-related protein [Proteobacteria bacterium]|nr:metallopeptidase TldD-related protein [Pseudomonadota bacterium]
MQQYFYDLADFVGVQLQSGEIYTTYLTGENSDFCRFSGGKVRQAGGVKQYSLSLRLINGQRHAQGSLSLSSHKDSDRQQIKDLLGILREQLAELPEDPYLLYATDVQSSEARRQNLLPDSREVVANIIERASGLDLVGIYAAGSIYRGFANSLGQRNWYESYPFNLDWSLYLQGDKAVKTSYAGFVWEDGAFAQKLADAKAQLAVLNLPPRTIKPGQYTVYLAPPALAEVTDMLSWNAFGLKAHRTKQTSLLKMVEAGVSMNSAVTMRENTAEGLAPDFSDSGYRRPAQVNLITNGHYQDSLVSPRSAKEYGVATNAAGDGESPQSLELAAGTIERSDVPQILGEGVYINNLWYLNYSDQSACRMTGLTRFASFWVENGEIKQPVNVMRFDESALRMLGDKLVGLTKERDMIMSAHTYERRSVNSAHLPGAVIKDFSFTL